MDQEVESREVGGKWECQRNCNGVVYEGDRCQTDGAMSSASSNLE